MQITGTKSENVTIEIDPAGVISALYNNYIGSIGLDGDVFLYEGFWCEDINSHCRNFKKRKVTEEEIEIVNSFNKVLKVCRSMK